MSEKGVEHEEAILKQKKYRRRKERVCNIKIALNVLLVGIWKEKQVCFKDREKVLEACDIWFNDWWIGCRRRWE